MDEIMEIIEAKAIIEEGKGIYGNRYRDAVEMLASEHRDDPCPIELTDTKTLEHSGFECKVFYNYVPPYNYGSSPINVWWGIANNNGVSWKLTLPEEIKTLEDACEFILPVFIKAVDRYKEKNG